MLDKKLRIKTGKDYKVVYKYGKKTTGKYMIFYIRKNEFLYNRFGIVTSKRVGNAVIRNRVKRQIRAIIRNNMDKIAAGNDIVIISRKNTATAQFPLIEKDFLIVMRKAGLC